MIINSNIEFEEIEYEAISKYLGEHLSKEEILEEGFEEIVYMKNETVKAKKKINEKDLDDPELFQPPVKEPNETEKRNMLAKSIELMIIISLENHVYKFGKKGAPLVSLLQEKLLTVT